MGLSRRHLLDATVGAALLAAGAAVASFLAPLLGVAWDGSELCDHYVEAEVIATRETVPEGVQWVAYDSLEPPAKRLPESVFDNGHYVSCEAWEDPALQAFLERVRFEDQYQYVVEQNGTYHWFSYTVEDMVSGGYPSEV